MTGTQDRDDTYVRTNERTDARGHLQRRDTPLSACLSAPVREPVDDRRPLDLHTRPPYHPGMTPDETPEPVQPVQPVEPEPDRPGDEETGGVRTTRTTETVEPADRSGDRGTDDAR